MAGCEHDETLGRQDFEGGPHSRPSLHIRGPWPMTPMKEKEKHKLGFESLGSLGLT